MLEGLALLPELSGRHPELRQKGAAEMAVAHSNRKRNFNYGEVSFGEQFFSARKASLGNERVGRKPMTCAEAAKKMPHA